jgi:hypothetical protein
MPGATIAARDIAWRRQRMDDYNIPSLSRRCVLFGGALIFRADRCLVYDLTADTNVVKV